MNFKSAMTDLNFRKHPPDAGPMPSINIGSFDTLTLSNGLRIIIVENRKLPKVAFQLVVDHDPVHEGPRAGLATIMGELLSRGTASKSKNEIDQIIDYYGANLHATGTGMYGSVLKKYQEQFVSIFTEILFHPSFTEAEFDKVKLRHASRLQTVKNEPAEMAFHVCNKVNFQPGHPYADIMDFATLDLISADDCRAHYDKYWRPECAYLAVVGDVNRQDVETNIAPFFESWVSGSIPNHTYPPAIPPKQSEICFVDRPNAVQSEVRLTYPVDLKPTNMDRIPSSVMNQVLGGGVFSGYLMRNLREDKGFTYGVRSVLSIDPVSGQFKASTSVGTQVTVLAIREILFEMNRIRNEQVDDDQLRLVKNSLIGSFARSIESPQTLANRVLNMLRFELPTNFYETFTDKLDEVSGDDVLHMASKFILPDNAYIVIVGDYSAMKTELATTFSDMPITFFDAFGHKI